MKIKLDSGITTIKSDEFIDREEERTFFWDKYDQLCEMSDDWQVTVINYWGMGGIGKSQILKKILQEAQQRTEGQKDKIPVAYISLSEQDSPMKIMNKMVAMLRQRDFVFPMYEAALLELAEISADPDIKKEIRSIEEHSLLISGLLDLAAVNPKTGIAGAVFRFVDKTAKHCREYIDKKEDELNALEHMLPEELERRLPEYLVQDLHWNMKSFLSTYPVIVFLDKLEVLRERITGVDEVDMQLGWLKDVIMPQVFKIVWVCSSREQLKWDREDDWKDSIYNLKVKAFDETWTAEYFKVNQMEIGALKEELFALTQGVPIYLNICYELYQKLRRKNEIIDIRNFGGRQERLLKTYLENLTKAEEDVLFALSCIGEWDEAFIRFAADKSTQSGFMEAYCILKKKSYIESLNGKTELHQVIREQIFAYCGETTLRSIADTIYEYMPKDRFSWFYPKYLRCRLKCVKTDADIDAWWVQPDLQLLKDLAMSSNVNGFEACYSVVAELTRGKFDDSVIHLFLSVFHIRNLIILKCFRQAQKEANYMIRICKSSQKQVSIEFRNLASEFFELKAQALDAQKKYALALNIREALCSDIACADWGTRISRKHNLVVSYQNLGQYDKALETFREVLEYRKQHVSDNPQDYIRALVLRFSIFMQYYEANVDVPDAIQLALQYGEEAYGEAHRLLEDGDSLLIEVDLSYARLLMRLHLWSEARSVLESVYSKLLDVNQGRNAYVDEVEFLLASVLTETGEYQRGLTLFEKIEANAKEYEEESERFLLRCQLEKGIGLSKGGQHEKARECLETAFLAGKQQYGYREIIVLQLAYAKAVEDYFLGCYDVCISQLKELLVHANALLSDGSIVVYMCKEMIIRCEQEKLAYREYGNS